MMRVMVVDDSGIYRLLLSKVLQEFSDIEVVGSASDGQDAIEKMDRLKPDVITLDMNMPRMNGMETLAVLAVKYPRVQVIVVSSETRNDAERVVSILEAGAFEMVLKPKATDSTPMQSLHDELYPKIKAAYERKKGLGQGQTISSPAVKPAVKRVIHGFSPDIIAIGSSTGGPAALVEVLSKIDGDFPLPVVVVQHMPKLFIETLAARLNRDMKLSCQVARENMKLEAGHVYFAAGEKHMDIVRAAGGALSVLFNDAAAEHHCKPAVDVTLRSLHRLAPAVKTLVVILTGMGSDGAIGAKLLADSGAKVIVQDEASSVVWGMPGATVKLGAVNEVLPIGQIGTAIVNSAYRGVK